MTAKNSINFKICTQCKLVKLLSEYYKSSKASNGLRCECKNCSLAYQRSRDGLVVRIYGHQVSHSMTRGYSKPAYTMLELKEWLLSHEKFSSLYNAWVASGYDKWRAPSCDRLDDYAPYSLGNLQLLTWQENHDKGHTDRKNGKNRKQSKKTLQLSLSGKFIAEFHSLKQASRETGVIFQNISKCCKGKRTHAGGYRWMFS